MNAAVGGRGKPPSRFARSWRRRRFLTAYRILRNEYERHRDAGHDVRFFAINESRIELCCIDCPELQP